LDGLVTTPSVSDTGCVAGGAAGGAVAAAGWAAPFWWEAKNAPPAAAAMHPATNTVAARTFNFMVELLNTPETAIAVPRGIGR
jgi:hypothetical protein